MLNNHQPSQTPNSGKINGNAFAKPASPNVKLILNPSDVLSIYKAIEFALQIMLLLGTSEDETFDTVHYHLNAKELIQFRELLQPYAGLQFLEFDDITDEMPNAHTANL